MALIQFFASRIDILSLLEAVERHGPLQYVRTGNEVHADFETFQCRKEIPNLGIANYESGGSCDAFLVTKASVKLRVRTLMDVNGVQRYLMDQLINPETVTITPAGKWGPDTVLQGWVGTASDSDVSQDLMKKFKSAFRKLFVKVQGRYVGADALSLLRAGKRLTAAVQSPPEYDLVMPPE